jgi:hypothetical protein
MAIAVYAKIAPIGLPDVYGKIAMPLPVVTLPLMSAEIDPRPYIKISSVLITVQARRVRKRGRLALCLM